MTNVSGTGLPGQVATRPGAVIPGAGCDEVVLPALPSFSSSRYYAKSASPAGQRPNARETRRRWRHARRRFLWLASTRERTRKCGRVRLAGDPLIRVRDGVAHYAGLTSCGDVWCCPVCSAKVRNARSVEIADAAGRWMDTGHGLYMAVLTVPHDAGMPLAQLWEAMTKALQAVRSGKAYQQVKADLGIVVTLTGKEVTEGANGWHPHLNLLFFTAEPASGDGLFDLLVYLRRAWAYQVVKAGLGEPDRLHGVKVEICYTGADAGLYVAKCQDGGSVGNELARGDLKSAGKGHRTPFEILADLERYGLVSDRDLWEEYEQVMRGKRALVWSRGYRAILGMDQEQTDEELAAAEVGGHPVASLPSETWSAVVASGKVSVPWSDVKLPMYTALLEAAELGGLVAVNETLSAVAVPLAVAPQVRGYQDEAGEAWAKWRADMCVRCRVAPRGPGGVVCPGCLAEIKRAS
jgi:hypothetical protein